MRKAYFVLFMVVALSGCATVPVETKVVSGFVWRVSSAAPVGASAVSDVDLQNAPVLEYNGVVKAGLFSVTIVEGEGEWLLDIDVPLAQRVLGDKPYLSFKYPGKSWAWLFSRDVVLSW